MIEKEFALKTKKDMHMTQEEKKRLYHPKPWALYCNGNFVMSYFSHNAAKRALHYKCENIKKYPYDYADEYYTIKPYNV